MRRTKSACRAFGAAIVAIASLAPGAVGSARAGYPERPIRVIVPFPPGGGGDTLARIVLNKIAEQQGWTIVIDNRPGAGGNIGTAAGAKADPDGYTLIYGHNGSFGTNHALYKNPGFDPQKDFAPISRFTQIALLLVTNLSVPANSAKDLIGYLRANPGKANVASAGNGTTSHLAQQMFKNAAGVDYLHVPYRGGGPAKIDLLSGQVQMMIEIMPSVLPLVQEGKLRGLAITTAKRWPLASEIPTLAEAALPGFEVTAWDGLWAPAGTPAEIIQTVNAAARKALTDPQLTDALLKTNFPYSGDQMRVTKLLLRMCMLTLAIATVWLGSGVDINAQEFPTRTPWLIIPYPPGGGVDTTARLLQPVLSERIRQQIVIDNKPGASTTIGTRAMAWAAPDGYTIGIITDSHAINAAAGNSLPYDSDRDFTFITQLVRVPLLLIVNPKKVPARSLRELVEFAKQNPVS